jgi:peptidoglycan/xylan/chitin deacetylase (PgdA/CDA1 family)
MLRQSLKKIAYASRLKTGFHKLSKPKHHSLILMYHGVTKKDHTQYFGRHLPAAQFEKHLVYFKKHFRISTLEELAVSGSSKQSGRNELPAIALTVDDGFANNLDAALPLLEKHKIPAMFYVTTLPLNKHAVLPSDLLDVVRVQTKEKELIFNNERYIKKGKHRLLRKSDGANIYEVLIKLPPADLHTALNEFSKTYKLSSAIQNTDPECFQLMNEDQVRQLSTSPYASIGSHTQGHYALTGCSDAELQAELVNSKKELERITGKKILSLAFPYGDHNERVIEQSRKAGYTTLLGAGTSAFKDVLPRAGIISAGSFEQNLLHIHNAFKVFGF